MTQPLIRRMGTGTGTGVYARDALVAALFLVVWVNLHMVAVAFETAPGASAWYPARGLSLALLLIGGVRFAPVVFLASLLGGRAYHLPAHPETWLGAALWITAGMSACAAWLRRSGVFHAEWRLRDAVRLLVALVLGAGVVAGGVVWFNIQAGLVPAQHQARVTFQFAVGDGIGLLIVVPLALQVRRFVLVRPTGPWREKTVRAGIDGALIALMAVLLLWLGAGIDGDSPAAPARWYLMLVPLATAAIRFGMPGAVVATLGLSIGVVAVARHHPASTSSLDLQMLLLTLSVVSLLLGAAVAERQRSQVALAALHAAQTRQARLEAEAARRSKARFLAATAHDLRPPFEALRLGLEALAMEQRTTGAGDGDMLVRTTRAMQSLGRVLDQVLDVARLDGELGQATPQVFAVRPVLAQLVQEASAGLPVSVRLRCGDWHALGDAVLLERVMRNLVANAAQAAAAGQGRVLVAARRRGAVLQVAVLDRGTGMAAPQLAQAFEAFVSNRPGGLGIGLSLVREIADELGLALRVRSIPGVGTTFGVSLPLARRSLSGTAEVSVRDRVIGLALRHRVRREWLAAVLSDWGAAVVTAASAPALQQELHPLGVVPDLLLFDDADVAASTIAWLGVPRLLVDPVSEPDLPALLARITSAGRSPAT